MKVSILGAGAMGSALVIPLHDNGIDVKLWGTEYDVEILKIIEKGEKHPRIGVPLPDIKIFYPEQLNEVLDAEIILLAVSTDGVFPVFNKIKDKIGDSILITISKGLLEYNNKILTIPETLWSIKGNLRERIVAITGPSIAREVANKMPTKVVFSSVDKVAAKEASKFFSTKYYSIEVADDIIGAEITAALKNVYSIAIAWIRGYEQSFGLEMSNAKGVMATMAINEIANFVKAAGGRKETVFGFSGFGDLIATFRGGRNGMLGELLGKGLSVEKALEELKQRGVGVVEGFGNAKRAYRLLKQLERDGLTSLDEFPLFTNLYSVLYEGKTVRDALNELFS
ncbi:glycerol-3-phosphate dehydrogenase [Archaeoglobales archaeon]|mgnify:CR=1 FL=1|nr:MAG: glycerol-3-phosphate dehydrogenase [Archaeoglobales archaeon]